MMLIMSVSIATEKAVGLGGSMVAVASGVYTWANVDDVTSQIGLAGVVAGVITALGSGIIVPLAKIWSEQKTADRLASTERHDLANKMQQSEFRIKELEELSKEAAEKAKLAEMAKDEAEIAKARITELEKMTAFLRQTVELNRGWLAASFELHKKLGIPVPTQPAQPPMPEPPGNPETVG